jgi:hypothetical protein
MRNSFTARCLLFFLPLAVLVLFAEWRLGGRPANLYGDKESRLLAGPRWQALVLGASHTMFGVKPSLVGDRAFNLAFPYETPELSTALLRHSLSAFPDVRTVYFGISYFSFRARLSELSAQAWRQFNYTRVLGAWPLVTIWDFLDLRNYSLYFALTTPIAKSVLLGRPVGREWDGIRDDGWIPLAEQTAELRTDAVARSRLHFYDGWMRVQNVATNRQALRQFAHCARAHGARVVFFTAPVTAAFSRLADPQVVVEREREMQALVAAEPGTVYLDFFNDLRYDPRFFFDTDHLNQEGASVFTARLHDAALSGVDRQVSRY